MSGGGAAEGGVGGGAAEVQYMTAKTSVWWDIENCQVPRVCDPHLIAQNISSALAKMDYKGPVTISAYGDTSKIPNSVQHALNSTGISLNHVPAGVKDASDKKILVDMLFWAVDNPPPSNYLLISGDRDFSNALHQLRMRRYNILLAQPLNVSQALFAAAKSVWLWTSLLAGGPPLSDSSNSTPDPQQTSQPSDSSGNQKGGVPGGNGKADSRSKTKQVRKNPSQTNTNLPRTPSKEFGQPVSESQESLTNGTSNSSDQKWRQNIQQPSTYMPMEPSSEAQEVAGMNESFSSSSFPQSSPQKPSTGSSYSYQPEAKQLKEAPHKFFGGNFPNASGPNYVPARPDFPMNQGKNKSHDHQAQYIQPLRPSDLLPQPNLQHGNKFSSHSSYPPPNKPSGSPFTSLPTRPDGTPSFTPNHPMPSGPPFTSQPSRPYGPAFTPPPPANLPDISGLNISGYPNGVHYNPSSFQQSPQHPGVPHHAPHFYHDNFHRPPPDPSMDRNMPNNGFWGTPGCPAPPFAVQGLIGNILRALHTLKTDKMAPTEANIVDCIRYGEMNIQNFDVKMALDYAIEHQVVVMHKLGGNLPFYVGKKDPLWKCVNIIDSNEKKHSKKIWDAILKFLSSNGGRSAVQASQCKYHAATILKQSCLKNLALGDVLQILHVIIHVKKWIITHSSGWQPLSFLLPATIAADTKADVGTSTNPRSHSPKTSM